MIIENNNEDVMIYFSTHLEINRLLKGEEQIQFRNRRSPYRKDGLPVNFSVDANTAYRLYDKKYGGKNLDDQEQYYDQRFSKKADYGIAKRLRIEL
jgi:hypothetical protein